MRRKKSVSFWLWSTLIAAGLLSGTCLHIRSGSGCKNRAHPDRWEKNWPHLEWISPGTFEYGLLEEKSTRTCVISNGFFLGIYEITWREWQMFEPQRKPGSQSKRHPASYISYSNAMAYCKFLSRKSGLTVRLPTEIEWEYAARAGIRQAPYPWGWNPPEQRSCFDTESACQVGEYEPNPFGLFDMAGNVFEWCQPSGGLPTGMHAARGGSWAERDPELLRAGRRTFFPADYRDADVGFRIVVEATHP